MYRIYRANRINKLHKSFIPNFPSCLKLSPKLQKTPYILFNRKKSTSYSSPDMRDHTPDFKMHELTVQNKTLIRQTVQQLLEKLAVDGKLTSDTLLEFWIEVPGIKRSRGTFRGGFLMPDSFIYISDYFLSDTTSPALIPGEAYRDGEVTLDKVWDDLLDELYYQVEIFTSPLTSGKRITLELWAGNRQRPEGEWIYAVDRKVELF
jgi:hypothetical protein